MAHGRLITWHQDGDYKPKDRGVLSACEQLHMMSTGAADFDENTWRRCREFLIERVTRWHASYTPQSEPFDAAVRALVEVALAEKHP